MVLRYATCMNAPRHVRRNKLQWRATCCDCHLESGRFFVAAGFVNSRTFKLDESVPAMQRLLENALYQQSDPGSS
jgi:hypothetical protein